MSGVISAYSTQKIRLYFVPHEIGELDYDLLLENVNDSENTVQIHVHSLTRQNSRNESLIISSHNIDFGDCCAGIMKKQRLTLKNAGDTPLEINFGSDKPMDVFFMLTDDESAIEGIAGPDSIISSNEFENLSSGVASSESDLESDSLSKADNSWNHERETSVQSIQSNSSTSSADSQPNRMELEMFLSKTLKSTLSKGFQRDTESNARIEEIILRPGSERVVEVCYMQASDSSLTDGKLSKQLFKLFLLYSVPGVAKTSDKVTIQCVSRVCTSIVKLSTDFVDFGISDVGTIKQSLIEIINSSDLPAIVKLKYESKVLTSIKTEIIIPARQKSTVKLDFYPRKINPDYRKVITVVNVLNPDNELTFTVHSLNVDNQRLTLHSYFYQLITAGLTHFVDFGVMSINSTALRAVTIENITDKDLVLKVDSSIPEDMRIYEIPPSPSKAAAHMSVDYKATILRKFELGIDPMTPTPSKVHQRLQRTSTSMREIDKTLPDDKSLNSNTEYLDLAILGKSSVRKKAISNKTDKREMGHMVSDSSELVRHNKHEKALTVGSEAANFASLSLKDFLALAERETSIGFPLFANFDSEESFVQRRKQIIKRLKSKIRSGGLTPASFLTVKAKQKKTIYLVMEITSDFKKYSKVLLLNRPSQKRLTVVFISK